MQSRTLTSADYYVLRRLSAEPLPCPGCGKIHALCPGGAVLYVCERLTEAGYCTRTFNEDESATYAVTEAGRAIVAGLSMEPTYLRKEGETAGQELELIDTVMDSGREDMAMVAEFFAFVADGFDEQGLIVAIDRPEFHKALQTILMHVRNIEIECERRGGVTPEQRATQEQPRATDGDGFQGTHTSNQTRH